VNFPLPGKGRLRSLAKGFWTGKRHRRALRPAEPKLSSPVDSAEAAAYERYLLNCSDYLKRQMIIYEHWPQRRYDTLGYRKEKVFTDMNA
jgi:hypothetical protein